MVRHGNYRSRAPGQRRMIGASLATVRARRRTVRTPAPTPSWRSSAPAVERHTVGSKNSDHRSAFAGLKTNGMQWFRFRRTGRHRAFLAVTPGAASVARSAAGSGKFSDSCSKYQGHRAAHSQRRSAPIGLTQRSACGRRQPSAWTPRLPSQGSCEEPLRG